MTKNNFFFQDSFAQYEFTDGTPKTVVFKNNINISKGVETDKKLPASKKEIQLSPEVLQKYIGTYQLAPSFFIEITVEGNQIYAQATNQPRIELFAEKEDHFFLKVVPANVTFQIDETTKLPVSLILEQGGGKTKGMKIK